MSTSASMLAGFEPRKPASRGRPLSRSIMWRASAGVTGASETCTSRSSSTSTPPMPTVTSGPNCGSLRAPTTISSPGLAISATSTPATRGAGFTRAAAAVISA